jgi:diacylglycerol kinase family enzyme
MQCSLDQVPRQALVQHPLLHRRSRPPDFAFPGFHYHSAGHARPHRYHRRAKHYAGHLMLAPDAGLHQPRLYLLRMKGHGRLTRLRQLSALAIGCLRYDPGVSLEPANWIRIEGDGRTPVQIDGEALGELPLEIGLHPKQLRIILPRQ